MAIALLNSEYLNIVKPMSERQTWVTHFLDGADDHAFTFLDTNGRFVEWSAGATKIYGYEPSEVLGQSARLIFVPEDAKRGLFEHELVVARAGGRMEDDRWMLRKDGQRIWVTGVVQAHYGQNGDLIGFSKIMRNRTDLKIKGEALESEIEALRAKVARNEKLFAVFAHELRNTLSPIQNSTQFLRDTLVTDETTEAMLGILERQVNTLAKLVTDLVDATRVVHGKLRCEMTAVDLGEILGQVADSCRPEINARKHNFRLLLPPTQIIVKGEPMRLCQIFTNLLSNAIKYTPNGGNIFLRATSDGDAVVTVEDNGIGIAPEILPEIFELFTQEEDAEHRTHSGLGIGLALVKDLVKLHGGSVQAKSDGKNKGSIFTIHLPVAQKF